MKEQRVKGQLSCNVQWVTHHLFAVNNRQILLDKYPPTTPPTEGLERQRGWGSSKVKKFKEIDEVKLEFLERYM